MADMRKVHTPGPWNLGESVGGQFFVYGAGGGQPFKPRVKLAKRHTKLEKANALLIAAAPELLAACKLAQRSLEDDMRNVHMADAAFGALADAISKAEGTNVG